LTLPLGGGSRARTSAAEAKAAEVDATAEATRRTIALAVSAAARSARASIRAGNASARARQAAEAELRATALGYTQGASSSLEVATARATYLQAVVDHLSALYEEAKALATFRLQEGQYP
jgi:outer membrane protein TolC